jgi:hypothetical protein
VVAFAGVATAAAAASGIAQTKAVFLQGRPVPGERFSAAITYWTGQIADLHISGGLCEASIRTRQGGPQRQLGSGKGTRLPDDSSLSNADVWSWKVPRTAAGKVLVVVCERLTARVESASSGPTRIKLLKRLPGFVYRCRIAGG